jgi:hypothetical protein
MTPINSIPIGIDIESVAVIRTHVLSIIFAIILSILVAKWILPTVFSYLTKKDDKRLEKVEAENDVLKQSLIRLADHQNSMNVAIIDGLNNMNKSMIEIRNLLSKNIKSISKAVMIIVLMFLLSGCDSDTITVYRFKKPQNVVTQKLEPSFEVDSSPKKEIKPDKLQVPSDDKPIKVKSCVPACSPPKSKCNNDTGECEGKAAQISSFEYTEIDRYGTFDPTTETFELLLRNK